MKINYTVFRLTTLFLLFALILSNGCKKSEPQTSTPNTVVIEPENTVSSSVAPVAADSVAVTVNGHEIMESDINSLIQPDLDAIAQSASQIPPGMLEQYTAQIRQSALKQLIETYLLDEKVKEANIVVTDEQVISEIEGALAEQTPPLTLDEYKVRLSENGLDFENEKAQITVILGYQKLLEPYWQGKINVTEDDAQAYYNENIKNYQNPEEIRASHILISVNEDDPNETKAQARAKIEDLLAQVKAGGDFAELAIANSDCPSAPQGGDLGFFSEGMMVEPFEEAAFKLQPGEISDVVETAYGYHIIKVTDHKEASTTPFEEAKDQIINEQTTQKQTELVQEYIQTLKDNAKIEYPADGQS